MSVRKEDKSAPKNGGGICIEWTGAGGDYYLAVVIAANAVIAERWGTRKDVLEWMDTKWPGVPRKFAPMVYSPVSRRRQGSEKKQPKKNRSAKIHCA
jgi:hypothetical protein